MSRNVKFLTTFVNPLTSFLWAMDVLWSAKGPYSEDRNAARILPHEFVGADPGRAPLPEARRETPRVSESKGPPWKLIACIMVFKESFSSILLETSGKKHQKWIEMIQPLTIVQTCSSHFALLLHWFYWFSACCQLMSVAPSVLENLSFRTVSPRKLLRCLNAIMATQLWNPPPSAWLGAPRRCLSFSSRRILPGLTGLDQKILSPSGKMFKPRLINLCLSNEGLHFTEFYWQLHATSCSFWCFWAPPAPPAIIHNIT